MAANIRGWEETFMEHISAGEFSVDSEGRIWRLVDRRLGLLASPRRAERKTPSGYLQVAFMHDGRRLYACAHRIVYRAMKGPIPDGCEVNHDNGLKECNHPRNLIAETRSGNHIHAIRHGLHDQHGQDNPSARLTDNQVAQIRLAYSKGGFTMQQLAVRFDVSVQHVSKIIRGKRRSKQGGNIATSDLRHDTCDRDPSTQRFVGKKSAGALLDGREWKQFPEVPSAR